MNKRKESSSDSRSIHKKMAKKLAFQFIACMAGYELALILLIILCMIIAEGSGLYYTDYFISVKPILIIFMYSAFIIASILGCCFIAYRFMLKPLEALDEVAEAAQKLARPSEEPIRLSGGLESIQSDLNYVREQALNSRRASRESARHKSDLLVYLAHDLKTPLTSILGYLKLIEDEPQISAQLLAKYIGISRQKAQRLEELINEFFELTRFSMDELQLEPSLTNLSRMLMQIANEFNPILKEKELAWQLEIAEGIEVVCDSDKLERAVDNLLRNAVSYSYSKTRILLSLNRNEQHVQICVVNHGQTIPPEKLPRIFEQFYRLDSGRSGETGGAGLGLAIAKEIVERHRGTITADSAGGTVRFTIELPLDCQKIV